MQSAEGHIPLVDDGRIHDVQMMAG
jgi:hypothetical protein